MGQLLFKKVFWDAIRGGTKRTTIRRWAAPRLRAGQRAWTPGVGWLAIESVERIDRLDRLTDADARADGFPSAAAMLAALRSLYPPAARDRRAWFRVAFRCADGDGGANATSTGARSRAGARQDGAGKATVGSSAAGTSDARKGTAGRNGAASSVAKSKSRARSRSKSKSSSSSSSSSPTSTSPTLPASLASSRKKPVHPEFRVRLAEHLRAALITRLTDPSAPRATRGTRS